MVTGLGFTPLTEALVVFETAGCLLRFAVFWTSSKNAAHCRESRAVLAFRIEAFFSYAAGCTGDSCTACDVSTALIGATEPYPSKT